MNERVAAIVDAVRVRVEDELRQQLESLETEHQRRAEEQQRAAEAATQAATEAATRTTEEQWTARLRDLEREARRAAVHHDADAAAVRLAEGGDAEEGAERAGHGTGGG